MSTQLDPASLPADLLYAVETGGDVERLRAYLTSLEQSRLERALTGRADKLAFWLNCYNAYTHLLLSDEPSALEGGPLERWKFFARDRVPVAGVWLSLADIHHGMLRGSKHPLGLGYLPRPFPSPFERRFRVERVDPRVHFALKTGGEHDPPLMVYSSRDIDEGLDFTAEWFLSRNVDYTPEESVVTIPRCFIRYRGDFGGTASILELLRSYDVIPAEARPTIEYKPNEGGEANPLRTEAPQR
ncbi:DUF547 domain-containing protein [Natrialbaceae archaeon GCM10025810]|uniref:DUF547 domain-containing protein n=1 Tax=Halovalidus salilacus TaxID=3075124 RepID=UPI00361BA475